MGSPTTPDPHGDNVAGSDKGRSAGEKQLDDLILRINVEGKVASWGDWILASGSWGAAYDL